MITANMYVVVVVALALLIFLLVGFIRWVWRS